MQMVKVIRGGSGEQGAMAPLKFLNLAIKSSLVSSVIYASPNKAILATLLESPSVIETNGGNDSATKRCFV